MDHFLDANMLVGRCLLWDSQASHVERYFDRVEADRHTSKRVYLEARGVFEGARREILRFLRRFAQMVQPGGDPIRIDALIHRKVDDYFRANRVRREGAVKAYIQDHMEDLRSYVLGTAGLDAAESRVRAAITKATAELDLECDPDPAASIRRHDGCLGDYNLTYPTECTQLRGAIGYDNDELVLLDAHYIRNNTLGASLVFISTDIEHIINNRTSIERILIGLSISTPQELAR